MPTSPQLKKINKYMLGLRYGTDVKGAAYSMADFGDELNAGTVEASLARRQSILTAFPTDPLDQAWYSRFVATIDKIQKMSPEGTILLVTGAKPDGERYGSGSEQTFCKCILLPSTSKIEATFAYGKDDSVPDVAGRIMAAVNALPDPGDDFM